MKPHLLLSGLLLFLLLPVLQQAQETYKDPSTIEAQIRQLQRQHADRLEITTLTTTEGGRLILAMSIGEGNKGEKPAIAIVGGIEGAHLLGPELALGVAQELLDPQNQEAKALLEDHTFYIIPQVSPDAAQQYFDRLRYERSANAKETDTDRDGRLNEDPGEDLNEDGLLTMIRVADETGEWMPHPADQRVLIKAAPAKGEKGRYHLFTEGIDNDKDNAFNEDSAGGVHFNKNLTFDYQPFTKGSGEFPVSEKETINVLEFLYDRWNVYAVLTFGPTENLADPWTYKRGNQKGRLITGILEEDARINKMASDLYKKQLKSPKYVKSNQHGGGFAEWAYFHYGRFSFSTPGWYVPEWTMPEDSTLREQYPPVKDNNKDINFLRWAADEGLDNYFVQWEEVDHPDFPDKKVEVGGIAPFVRLNPPFEKVADLIDQHTQFVMDLARHSPSVSLINVRKEKVSNGLWRVKATVMNEGFIPTTSQIGDKFKWVKRLRVDLKTQDDQQVLNGQEVYLFPGMAGRSTKELSWLIKGNGEITIQAAAPQCGKAETVVNLN